MKNKVFHSAILWILFFIFSALHAENASSKTIVKGILLLGENAPQETKQIQGVQSIGFKFPGDAQAFKQDLNDRFIGRELNSALFMRLRSQILKYFSGFSQKPPRIVVPLQDFKEGIIQIYLVSEESQDDEERVPLVREKKNEERIRTPIYLSKKPQIPSIRHLILVSSEAEVGKHDLSKRTVNVFGLKIPGTKEEFEEALLPLFYNQCVTQELLTKLKRAIITFYQDHNRPVVAVLAPEQDVTEGYLYLVVIEGHLGDILVKGNRWFSDKTYRNEMRLKKTEQIRSDVLLSDLAWINRNPCRHVDAVFTPGQKEGTTDIELLAKDKFPLQFYAGGDNTGTSPTGDARYFAGITWANAFWLDHVLTYQFTSSSTFKKFKSHTIHYTAPLPWRHLFIVYGGYAIIHPKMDDFHVKGHTFQSSVRYTAPFGRNFCGSLQQLTIGFDFKNTDNSLLYREESQLFRSIPLIVETVNLTQFMASYTLGRENDWHKLSFNLDLYYSPAKFLAHQSNEDFSKLSPHAKSKYVYGRMTIGEIWYFPYRYSLSMQGRLQLASEVLLQSEQFGLGGYDTVRGYPEREFNADNALCLNVEFRTRTLSITRFFNHHKIEDELYFLVFFDYGLGNVNDRNVPHKVHSKNPKIPVTEYLMSFGPGVRYYWNDYISFRADWGIKLHRTIFSDSSRSKFHVGLVVSY